MNGPENEIRLHDWVENFDSTTCRTCGALMSQGPDARALMPCPGPAPVADDEIERLIDDPTSTWDEVAAVIDARRKEVR